MIDTSSTRGFTLLELMVGLAVTAILATIAIGIYQNYQARARGTDIVLKYDVIRTQLGADLVQNSSAHCDELAKRLRSDALKDPYAQLGYGFEAVAGGFRPVLTVCARADTNGPVGVKAARGAHETLAKAGTTERGAVLTDTLVSFALPLTDANRAACKVAPTTLVTVACGAPTTASTSATPTPPVATPAEPTVALSTAARGCNAGHEKVVIPAAVSNLGKDVEACVLPCPAGQTRSAANPLTCTTTASSSTSTPPQTPNQCLPHQAFVTSSNRCVDVCNPGWHNTPSGCSQTPHTSQSASSAPQAANPGNSNPGQTHPPPGHTGNKGKGHN